MLADCLCLLHLYSLYLLVSYCSSSEDSLSDLDMLQLEQLVLLLESKPFALVRMDLLQQPVDPHLVTAIRGKRTLLLVLLISSSVVVCFWCCLYPSCCCTRHCWDR